MGQTLSVAAAVAIPLAGGIGISFTVQKEVKGWYKHLKKPSWQPPNWIFGPVWTVLYAAMGYASYLVYEAGGGAIPLTLYGLQLALNFAWTPLFFKEHKLTFALADITALLGVLSATIVEFNKVSPDAAKLLLPYLGWTTFAAALTLDIWKRNPEERRTPKSWHEAGDSASAAADDAAAKLKSASETAADKFSSATDTAAEKFSSATDAAAEKLGAVTDAAADKLKSVKGKAEDEAKSAKAEASSA